MQIYIHAKTPTDEHLGVSYGTIVGWVCKYAHIFVLSWDRKLSR